MKKKLIELYSYRDFVRQITLQLLRVRYQGSFLGFLWTLGYPLLVFASFSIVFSLLNHWNLRDFGIYFFSGYIAWNFFANTIQHAAESVVSNGPLLTRIYVPKAAFPLGSLALHMIDLGASLAILFVLMIIFGTPFRPALAVLPLSIFILGILVAGFSMIAASLNVFFRDFRHLISAVLFIWFFFSPILWKPALLPPEARKYAGLNPISPFIHLFQDPIWGGHLPTLHTFAYCLTVAVLSLSIGLFYFFKSEANFYFYL